MALNRVAFPENNNFSLTTILFGDNDIANSKSLISYLKNILLSTLEKFSWTINYDQSSLIPEKKKTFNGHGYSEKFLKKRDTSSEKR